MPSTSETVGGEDFATRVLAVVDSIPPGHVMTYGSIAAALGSRAARMVGHVMAHYGSDAPWWRVVRATGQLPKRLEHIALEHYLAEGTPLLRRGSQQQYRVDVEAALHNVR